MFFLKKLKAGALQYTIFVSVLILLLVSAFITLVYLQQKLRVKASFFQETVYQATMGFDYVATHGIPYEEELELNFNEEVESNIILIKKHWGIFDVITSKSSVKNEFFQKTSLTGGFTSNKEALYLKENNKPLVLVGNTEIRGNVALPRQGVKRGNIAGNSYYGSQLIYGNTRLSTSQLPMIANKEYIKQLSNGNFLNDNITHFELEENLQKVQSFDESTLLYQSNGSVNLQFVKLTGNIIIRSTTKITISKSAVLKDVILIAPKIEVYDNVRGNFQAFATEQINIGKQCSLEYPTALTIIEKAVPIVNSEQESITANTQLQTTNQITINYNSTVKGIVTYLSESTQNNYKPQIILEEIATIVGEVYCERNFELKGTVKGMVYTDSFVATQFGSVYINHIFNGRIIATELPEEYCGLQLPKTKTNVAKWIY